MFGVIEPYYNRVFYCIFGWYFYIKIRLKYEKNVLLSISRAFLLSIPTFSLSTSEDNNEATWKKATKCNKSLGSTREVMLTYVRDPPTAWWPRALLLLMFHNATLPKLTLMTHTGLSRF